MSRKALHLVVDLEIQVTCPGVWLCPNGNVQLLFSMLGEEVQTKRLPPVFPLLFHEKLVFQKTFPSAGCLAEVQDALGRENVYAVLIQEVEGPNGSAAVQLARFHSSALHILYPSPCSKGLLAGVDVDLLMEASADFPGILSPKIELSTKTIVKEVASAVQDGYIINPKTLSSQRIPLRHCAEGDVKPTDTRGKFRVCSTRQPERSQKFKHGQGLSNGLAIPRVSPSRIQQRSSHSNVSAHPVGHVHCTEKCGLQDSSQDSNEFCQCGTEHLASKCPLCMQYKTVFSSFSDFKDTTQDPNKNHPAGCMRKRPISARVDNMRRLSKSLHEHVDRILEPTMSNILPNRDFNVYAPFSQSQSHHGFSQRKQESNIAVTVKKPCESDPYFQASCGSGDEYISHRQLFYANLEKFYRKLYDRAKSRAQEENCSGANGN